MKEKCSSDRETLLKLEAEGQEFANFLRLLVEQSIQIVKVQNNFCNRMLFQLFPGGLLFLTN